MNKKTMKQEKMKNAYIENILMWIVIFTGFVWTLFFVVDYASVIRIQDNMNAMADYGARIIGLNGESGNDSNFIQNLNTMRVNAINPINSGNVICSSVSDGAFQVIFNVRTTNTDYKFYTGSLSSRRVVFNETNTNTITCNLSVTIAN